MYGSTIKVNISSFIYIILLKLNLCCTVEIAQGCQTGKKVTGTRTI